MREIVFVKGAATVTIRSPWLSREEAAAYLGVSLAEFKRRVANLCPSHRFGRIRKFHVEALDRFDPEKQTGEIIDGGKTMDK